MNHQNTTGWGGVSSPRNIAFAWLSAALLLGGCLGTGPTNFNDTAQDDTSRDGSIPDAPREDDGPAALDSAADIELGSTGNTGSTEDADSGVDSNPKQDNHPSEAEEESSQVDDFEDFAIAPPPGDESFKPKTSQADKLAALLTKPAIPTAFGGAFLQLSRRYLAGHQPQNELERSAFRIFEVSPPSVREAMVRVLDSVDAMSPADRQQVYGKLADAESTSPLTARRLASELASEVSSRVGLASFGSLAASECVDAERAGLPRVTQCPDIDNDFPGFCNQTCRIKTPSLVSPIRLDGFVPAIAAGAYLPEETERGCTVNAAGGPPICRSVESPNCSGNSTPSGDCLAVPTVVAGESITFQGFNFFDVDAVVVITARSPLPFSTREVPAHVCGDITTDAAAATDCNVNDFITFKLPADLAVGSYRLNVKVPNNTGDPVHDRREYGGASNGGAIVNVLPAPDTEFELTAEELLCRNETGRTSLGSDEVGIQFVAVRAETDGSLGPIETLRMEFGNVDNGDRRPIDSRLYRGRLGAGLAVAIVGHEIDSQAAYEQNITAFQDAFVLILASNWSAVSSAFGAAAGGIATVFGGPAVGAAVAAGVAFAINAVVALWAPADLIIEDGIGITFADMAELTSVNFPNPPLAQQTSVNGIDVVSMPCEDTVDLDRPECGPSAKVLHEYTEIRQYDSSEERSRYQLTLRHRRVN